MTIHSKRQRKEGGYVLLGILLLLALGLVVTAGMLQSATGTLSTRKVTESNTKNFYDVERTINMVTAWLQDNSKNLVNAFNSSNFSNNFDLGDPVAGVNEGTAFAVPTLVKMKGTNNAVQLTNSAFFGTSAFPQTTNIDTNASFDAVSAFEGANFGTGVNVRLLMVWALATDGHYQPIFRVDAVTGGSEPEHGVHGLNFIRSSLLTGPGGVGFYASGGGLETGSPNNVCWSYKYSWDAGTNAWNRGAARSNCIVLGRAGIALKSAIHGSVLTNQDEGITLNGGSVSGTMCQHAGCHSYSLPVVPDWQARCGGEAAVTVVAAANPTNLVSGDALSQQCYQDVTIPSNKTINFATADKPYYIKNLVPQNNSNSKITFTTVGPGHKYILYVDNLANGAINGNQLVATNLAPNQLEIYITKGGTLILNGTASMNGVITGREDLLIKHAGNFPFYGAYRAGTVKVIGNATLGYDEALGSAPALTDISFSLYKASQRYR